MNVQQAAEAMRDAAAATQCRYCRDKFKDDPAQPGKRHVVRDMTGKAVSYPRCGATAIRALPLPAPEATAGETALRERVAMVIEQAHAPQSVGSHARALWIADAVLAALAAPAEAVIDANDYTGVPKSGAVLHAERQAQQAEAERAVVQAARAVPDVVNALRELYASGEVLAQELQEDEPGMVGIIKRFNLALDAAEIALRAQCPKEPKIEPDLTLLGPLDCTESSLDRFLEAAAEELRGAQPNLKVAIGKIQAARTINLTLLQARVRTGPAPDPREGGQG